MNVFLRDIVYCQPLCDYYGLAQLQEWLELPLDSETYAGIVRDSTDSDDVSPWPGVKRLDSEVSAKLQTAAVEIARRLGTSRVHLDVKYWRKRAIDELDV